MTNISTHDDYRAANTQIYPIAQSPLFPDYTPEVLHILDTIYTHTLMIHVKCAQTAADG